MPKGQAEAEIVIDLSESRRNADDWRPGELIQEGIFQQLANLIRSDLRSTPRAAMSSVSLTYFIDGTRGAGKSTFLRYAYDHLHKKFEGEDANQVHKLLLLDPSRIEDTEIVLLHVVKALDRCVNEAVKRSSTSAAEAAQARFRKAVAKMAGGLHLFVKDHAPLKDLDADVFLEYGLDRANDSQQLRANLHAVIEAACDAIGVRAFILAIDDAETNAQSAFHILESLRKYLDTPRLVTLVTGDMELYSLLVQKQFVNGLSVASGSDGRPGSGASDLLHYANRANQRRRMVDHLEEQYLLKLFPTHRRFQLRPIWYLMQRSPDLKFDVKVEYELSGDASKALAVARQPFLELVALFVRQGLRLKSNADVRRVVEYFLKLPLRSLLQALWLTKPGLEGRDAKATIDETAEAIRAMALSSLYGQGVDVDSIGLLQAYALSAAVFKLSLIDGESDTGAYLRPQPVDAELRNCFVSLSADVARLCAGEPAKAIDYMLGASGSLAVYRERELKTTDAQQTHVDYEISHWRRQFEQYMSIGRDEDSLNWAMHATAALTGQAHRVGHGIIGLNRYGSTKTKKDSIQAALSKNLGLRRPAISFTLVDVKAPGGVQTYASIFNLLGIIARLLAVKLDTPFQEADPASVEKSKKHLHDEVAAILARAASGATVSPPPWAGSRIDIADDKDDDTSVPDGSDSDKQLNQSIADVVCWLSESTEIRTKCLPSALFLGKVWARLFLNLVDASETLRPMTIGAASMMEVFAACLLNALLIEESEHHLSRGSSGEQHFRGKAVVNPRKSADLLLNRLREIVKLDEEEYPFTLLVARCPLVAGLFNAESMPKSAVESKARRGKPQSDSATKQVPAVASVLDEWQARGLMCSSDAWKAIDAARVIQSAAARKTENQRRVAEVKATSIAAKDSLARAREVRTSPDAKAADVK